MLLGYARGKVGDLVFARRLGQQTTRAYNSSPKDAKTRSQVTQRVKMANVIAMYRALKNICNHSFEGLDVGQTSYSAFVKANLTGNKVSLTKEAASFGACVVAPYLISRGSLPSIQVEGTGADAVTNIAVGSLTISETTTIGQFADALVANNAGIEYGDQLTYVSLVQQTDANSGYPIVVAGIYEVTLNSASTDKVRDFIPEVGSSVKNGFLAHGALIGRGGFAWILSRKQTGSSLMVSTQRLVLTSPDVYDQFATADANTRAISSYGFTMEPILAPGVVGAPAGPSAGGGSGDSGSGGSSSGGSSDVSGNPSVSSIKVDDNTITAATESDFSLAEGQHTLVINGSNLSSGMNVTFNNIAVTISSATSTTATGTFNLDARKTISDIVLKINGSSAFTWAAAVVNP